ncbi:MAG: 50S ribosomal protein L31 [Endomicrobium sp.]|nr:50S ribosomal protein L31 [Endomicrobium sp.]
MKSKSHPNYIRCCVSCACGYKFETLSTKDVIKIEICSHCHPFFSGQNKLIDTAGRIEKYKNRLNKKTKYMKTK